MRSLVVGVANYLDGYSKIKWLAIAKLIAVFSWRSRDVRLDKNHNQLTALLK
ncbi:MAG: hypothetical protein ACRAVC_03275 [Trichormus sp.]